MNRSKSMEQIITDVNTKIKEFDITDFGSTAENSEDNVSLIVFEVKKR